MKLKGKLIIIGGAEDKGVPEEEGANTDERDFLENGILRRLVEESIHKHESRIEIITTASTVPKEIGADYLQAFEKLNARNTGTMHMSTRDDAEKPEYLKRLKEADVLFFTGGSQLRLTSILGGTSFFDLMLEKLQKDNFIYAGTSAGAAAASESMIIEGRSENAILKGEVKITSGFGLIKDIVFDTHFIHRGRIGRLFQIILTNPKILGVGLEENTGLLITSDGKMEAIGSGMTILIDGRFIQNSNLLDVREGVPLSIDNLTLHVMSEVDVFDLKTRKLEIRTPDECRP